MVMTMKDLDNLAATGTWKDVEKLEGLLKYFEAARPGRAPFSPRLTAKQEDLPQADGGEGGTRMAHAILCTIRSIRSRHLRENAEHKSPLIVAAGDSWVQHPLPERVDLLDPISKHYPVLVIGDAPQNLAQSDNWASLVQEVADRKADVLLLSVGGNNLLGQENGVGGFGGILRANLPDDPIDETAVKDVVASTITSYGLLLSQFLDAWPQLTILIHGYDYVSPRADQAWLGQQLAERALNMASGRQAVEGIIDHYNEALRQLANTFGGSVRYLDLRGKVGNTWNSWYEETHPSGAAVDRLASDFIDALDALANTRPEPAVLEACTETALLDGLPHEIASMRKRCAIGAEAAANSTVLPRPVFFASGFEAMQRFKMVDPDICRSLERWREAVSGERDNYNTAIRLADEITRPETRERIDNYIAFQNAYREAAFTEAQIGKSNLHGVEFLEIGLEAQKAVGRVRAKSLGMTGTGTGFLVGGGLLLTNNHVIDQDFETAKVTFNFQRRADGFEEAPARFPVTRDVFLTDAALDFTFVSLGQTGPVPLDQFGRLQLLRGSGKELKRNPVSIVQHPGGEMKQLAIFDSHILGTDGSFIYYTTDTEQGSSGAPVFSRHWNVVALHHKTVPDFERPCKFIANRGIRISEIYKKVEALAAGDGADAQRQHMAREVLRRIESGFEATTFNGQADWRPSRAHTGDQHEDTVAFDAAPVRPLGEGLVRHAAPALLRGTWADAPHDARDGVAFDEEIIGGLNWATVQSSAGILSAIYAYEGTLRADSGSVKTLGTAFAVSNRLAVTAKHNWGLLTPQTAAKYSFNLIDYTGGRRRAILRSQDKPRRREHPRDFGGVAVANQRFQSFLAYGAAGDADNREIAVLGFPHNNPDTLHRSPGQLLDVAGGLLFHDADTLEGHSGGPIIDVARDIVIGVHIGGPDASGRPNQNVGFSFDNAVLKEIERW